ncbi:alpha/beta hydrolase [Tomitella fengzijianii]|uniref:Alpha/beta hydrolase n=1 Tax=Tomitella fengzijianii TaxID=2597660 RepID=A0A516X8I0_9ACTN|nr:alpha/beta hydrolase [Tomitella fengzijianii]
MAKRIRRLARVAVKPLMTIWPMTERGIDVIERADHWAESRIPYPAGADITDVLLGGVRCERTMPREAATAGLAGGAVLYLHGGAFLFGGPSTHRGVCALLAKTAGVPVYSVEYRQLPAGPVSASVADAVSAYTALLESVADPSRIIVGGDSAGGYLAMKVAEIAALRSIRGPAAVIGYSPLLDLVLGKNDPGYFRRDAYLPTRPLEKLRERWLDGPAMIEGAQSPVDADPALFPPVFLSAAEYELLRPGVEVMTQRLHDAGVPVETHLWVGQVHAFPAVGPRLPEAREIVRLSVEFARRAVAGRPEEDDEGRCA